MRIAISFYHACFLVPSIERLTLELPACLLDGPVRFALIGGSFFLCLPTDLDLEDEKELEETRFERLRRALFVLLVA